ncbi:MAG: biotin/lipoyl-binding protein [Pseudomonadota bacterium]
MAAVHVENGQRVKAGDVLIEMDPADAKADELDMAATLQGQPLSQGLRRRPTRSEPRLPGETDARQNHDDHRRRSRAAHTRHGDQR